MMEVLEPAKESLKKRPLGEGGVTPPLGEPWQGLESKPRVNLNLLRAKGYRKGEKRVRYPFLC